MEKKYIIKASNILLENRLNRNSIESFPENCIPKNENEAYEIQDELLKLYLNLSDNEIIGKKVGCTNHEAQKQFLYSLFKDADNATKIWPRTPVG